MTALWACIAHPEHGAFPRDGIVVLQRICAWARRPMDRLACPVCAANGGDGHLRRATADEVERDQKAA